MKRDIKDYINFYIGQKVRITITKERVLELILVGTNLEDDKLQVNLKTENNSLTMWYRWDKNMSLLLRPIPSITIAEEHYRHHIKQNHPFEKSAAEIHYLCSRGMDVFGLIDARLATNKTIT